jgi:hypothetical protein
LANSTIRDIHQVLHGAYKKAVRWRWVSTNPVPLAEPPPAPAPDPRPPSAEDAARLVEEAWKDPDWDALVVHHELPCAEAGKQTGHSYESKGWMPSVTGVPGGRLSY